MNRAARNFHSLSVIELPERSGVNLSLPNALVSFRPLILGQCIKKQKMPVLLLRCHPRFYHLNETIESIDRFRLENRSNRYLRRHRRQPTSSKPESQAAHPSDCHLDLSHFIPAITSFQAFRRNCSVGMVGLVLDQPPLGFHPSSATRPASAHIRPAAAF